MAQCKIVMVIMGEDPNCMHEISLGVEMEYPIIIVKGSPFSDKLIEAINGKKPIENEQLASVINKGHFYILDKEDSEDLANMVNFFFTVRPF